jgi:sugar (pentulose or hexulose) kinase
MVANVDVDGEPIAATLTMTGREYAILAGPQPVSDARALDLVPEMLARGTLALPSFAEDDGAVPGSAAQGHVLGPPPQGAAEQGANAALYAAYTADLCLDILGSTTPIVIDGGFATNHAFAGLLATLRPGQEVKVSRSRDGTALGAGLLWRRFERTEPVNSVAVDTVAALPFTEDLRRAAQNWRALAHCDI